MNYVPAMFHLFFITLFTTRMEETNLFVEVNTSTFQIWDERPLCRIVPTALTVSPSCAEEMWFPLTCIPTTISSGSQIIMEPSPATVSAKARVAPPCKMPKGWRVRLAGELALVHNPLLGAGGK